MILADLHEASFRGAQFFIKSSATSSGHKIAKKLPIDSDKQLLENLGLKQDVFTVSGAVAARRTNDGAILKSYQQARDELIIALKLKTVGVLIHPFYGRFDNIVATQWTLDESTADLGEGKISITFEVSNTDGVPVPSVNVLSNVASQTTGVASQAQTVLATILTVFANNFQDSIDKLDEFTAKIDEITAPIRNVASNFDSYNRDLIAVKNNTANLVNNPATLASSVVGLITSIDDLEPVPHELHLAAFSVLFNYGDDDIAFPTSTAESTERQRNRDLMNTTIKASALAFNYLQTAEINFNTVEEIEAENDRLDVQYQELFSSTVIDVELLELLTDLRVTAQGFLDEEKLNARRVIVARTNPTSTRALAYQYYGSSDLGDQIAELNMFTDASLIEGDVKIFTS